MYTQGDKYKSLLPFVGPQLCVPKRPADLTNTTRIFAANLGRLLGHYQETPAEAARRCRISQQQMDRLKKCKQSPTLDSVHKIARGYNLEAYQLLVPNLNPSDLAVTVGAQLWHRLKEGMALLRELENGTGSTGRDSGAAPDKPREGRGDHDPPRKTPKDGPAAR